VVAPLTTICLSLEEFCEVYDTIMTTNKEWMQESQRRMKEKYESAAAAARKCDSSKKLIL